MIHSKIPILAKFIKWILNNKKHHYFVKKLATCPRASHKDMYFVIHKILLLIFYLLMSSESLTASLLNLNCPFSIQNLLFLYF